MLRETCPFSSLQGPRIFFFNLSYFADRGMLVACQVNKRKTGNATLTYLQYAFETQALHTTMLTEGYEGSLLFFC